MSSRPNGGRGTGRTLAAALAAAVVAASACADTPGPYREGAAGPYGDRVAGPYGDRVAAYGDPRPDLTDEEAARFRRGRAAFDRIFEAGEGLGPLFNENQCSACHTDPVSGGTGEQLVRKASAFTPDAGCDPMLSLGGENLRQRVTVAAGALGVRADEVPPGASHNGRFTVPFLFGLGGADLVTEETLLSLADPDDRDGDGISGTVGRTADGAVGRFGRKADVATLSDFTRSALLNEMGVTTPGLPGERGRNGGPLPEGADPAPDPELDSAAVREITDYVRFLGVPPGGRGTEPELVRLGEETFADVGCARCHVPALPADPPGGAGSPGRALLYSDLLLHDLGEALAGPCTSGASPGEYRTAPLIGLGARRTYLHDGRARSLEAAVMLHGGEAAATGARFEALDPVARAALVAFLETL